MSTSKTKKPGGVQRRARDAQARAQEEKQKNIEDFKESIQYFIMDYINNNIKSFIYVSSGGANADSRNLYLQNKGKAEKEIINLSFDFTAIIQPSLLLGDRKENRVGERIAKSIFKSLSFIFVGKLRSFKAIHANNVAKAIMHITKNQLNDLFFTSDKLEDLSRIN